MKSYLSILLISSIVLYSCSSNSNSDQKKIFKWNFTQSEKMEYSFEQEINSESIMYDKPTSQSIIGGGKIIVNVESDSLASIQMADVKVTYRIKAVDIDKSDSEETKIPDIFIPGMRTNGTFTDPDLHVLYRIIFPLPTKELEEGETQRIEVKQPVNMWGSSLKGKGYIDIKYLGEDEFEGKVVSKFSANYLVNELDIPKGMDGKYKFEFEGEGVYYFDHIAGHYVASDMEAHALIEVTNDQIEYMKSDQNLKYKVRFLNK